MHSVHQAGVAPEFPDINSVFSKRSAYWGHFLTINWDTVELLEDLKMTPVSQNV